MQTLSRGLCPFRIQLPDFQSGCVLQLKKEATCYTQDLRPLMHQNNQYTCPLLGVRIDEKLYAKIEILVDQVLAIQTDDEICSNCWPMLSGIARMKNSETLQGLELEQLAEEVTDRLQDIVMDFS
ncbi:MAG: hypothetical protein ACFFFG_00270 [Candidatus Thorarchaeota archaeon]